MIILTKEFLNNEQFNNLIEKEKLLINSRIESQNTLKSILLDYMQKLADSTDNIDSENADTILNLLNDFKHCLELFKINTELFNGLQNSLDTIDYNDSANIDVFNKNFFESNDSIIKNTLQIEKVIQSVLKYFKLSVLEQAYTTNFEPISAEPINNQIPEIKINEKLVQNINTEDINENTLIISETKGKIFLPYTNVTLNNILINEPEKYSNIEDVIEKEYTLPYDSFKSPAVARFRESFKLIRKKEQGSIKEAFDLGMELLFNYNLHPAIISACKNIDELDIYLDYLENNETDKFDCFKIVFDIAPIISKNRKS